MRQAPIETKALETPEEIFAQMLFETIYEMHKMPQGVTYEQAITVATGYARSHGVKPEVIEAMLQQAHIARDVEMLEQAYYRFKRNRLMDGEQFQLAKRALRELPGAIRRRIDEEIAREQIERIQHDMRETRERVAPSATLVGDDATLRTG